MASWIQAQLNAAQDLLEGIDKTVGGAAKVNNEAEDFPQSSTFLSSSDHNQPTTFSASNADGAGFTTASGPPPFLLGSNNRQESLTDLMRTSSGSNRVSKPSITHLEPSLSATSTRLPSSQPKPFARSLNLTKASKPSPADAPDQQPPAKPFNKTPPQLAASQDPPQTPSLPSQAAPPTDTSESSASITPVDSVPAPDTTTNSASTAPETSYDTARSSPPASEAQEIPSPEVHTPLHPPPPESPPSTTPSKPPLGPPSPTASASPVVPPSGAKKSALAAPGPSSLSLASISSATGIFEELADGLLGNGPSSSAAQSVGPREQQLARMVEQQRKRLDTARAEAEQLEEMLHAAEGRATAKDAACMMLQEELRLLQEAKSLAGNTLHSELSSLKASNRELTMRCEALQQQALRAEAEAAALEESNRMLVEREKGIEGGMLEALKAELTAAEQRLDVEHKAHQATRASYVSRERELEHLLSDTSNALADTQRGKEDILHEIRELKDEKALLEAANKELTAQVAAAGGDPSSQAMGGGLSVPRTSSEASLRMAELEALRTEAAQQHRALKQSEAARTTAEKRLQELKGELDLLHVEVERFASKKDTTQLEAQLRESSDMMILKQSQIEKLASDKAAGTMRLERELSSAREEIVKLRHQVSGYSSGYSAVETRGHEVIPMDALGAPYRRLAASNNRVGKAVKAAAGFLDSTASATTFFIRQYPLARLIIFGYLVLVHLYVYVLTGRMQAIGVHLDAIAAVSPVIAVVGNDGAAITTVT